MLASERRLQRQEREKRWEEKKEEVEELELIPGMLSESSRISTPLGEVVPARKDGAVSFAGSVTKKPRNLQKDCLLEVQSLYFSVVNSHEQEELKLV